MKKENFYYERIIEYNRKRYDGILNTNNISGDEIAIKNKEEDTEEFFFPLKKDKVNYLLPAEQVDQLPLKIVNTEKISWRSKAYERIYSIKSIKITGQQTMSYKQWIDKFLPFEHIVPKEFLVWKIVCDVAYRKRINIRAISYPGWLKTSAFIIFDKLRSDCFILDNSSFAKSKYILSAKPKVLVQDEVDDIDTESVRDLSKLFRAGGDFRPDLENNTRATGGTLERFDLTDTSVVALYNFPKNEIDNFFEDKFHSKILSRLFPLLLDGGSHTDTPCKERFELFESHITGDDFEEMTEYLKNHVWFEENDMLDKEEKDMWKHDVRFGDTRWQRNFDTIAEGIKRYAETKEEFLDLINVLKGMNDNYITYIENRNFGEFNWVSKATEEKPTNTVQVDNLQQLEEEII